jgi:hypothetical protein
LQGWTIAQVRIGRLANALVGLVLLFNAVYLSADVAQKAPMPVLLGLQSEGAYYANQLGWAAPALQAVKALPPGSQALLLFEARYMLCRPGCVPDEILDRWLVARRLADGDDAAPEAILQQWRATGLTHLLVHLDGVQFLKDDPYLPYTPTDWQALDSLLNSLPVQQDFGGAYRLYRLAP